MRWSVLCRAVSRTAPRLTPRQAIPAPPTRQAYSRREPDETTDGRRAHPGQHDPYNRIDLGAIALQELQRGPVWNGSQARAFVHFLGRRYPVGSLLVSDTRQGNAQERTAEQCRQATVSLRFGGQ